MPKLMWRPTAMEDQSKMFIWELEDGETGLIRTIKIPMPNLDRDYDPSESHEIILDRRPRLENREMSDWIESYRRENLTDDLQSATKTRANQPMETINS